MKFLGLGSSLGEDDGFKDNGSFEEVEDDGFANMDTFDFNSPQQQQQTHTPTPFDFNSPTPQRPQQPSPTTIDDDSDDRLMHDLRGAFVNDDAGSVGSAGTLFSQIPLSEAFGSASHAKASSDDGWQASDPWLNARSGNPTHPVPRVAFSPSPTSKQAAEYFIRRYDRGQTSLTTQQCLDKFDPHTTSIPPRPST